MVCMAGYLVGSLPGVDSGSPPGNIVSALIY